MPIDELVVIVPSEPRPSREVRGLLIAYSVALVATAALAKYLWLLLAAAAAVIFIRCVWVWTSRY